MIHKEEVEYKDGDVLCRGYIAYNSALHNPKPCVLIAHDWGGRGEEVCKKAEQLAEMGYVGFAIDMYGNAKTGETYEEKNTLFESIIHDRKRLAERINKALQFAQNHKEVNQNKIAAIGYCFGGLCVLDLARSAADIKGVISFHGILSAPSETECKPIKAKVLVLHGYEDPMAPPKQVAEFAKEMTAKKVDWQIHWYGNTQHAFTNPNAHDIAKGLQYNATADKRSWLSATQFFKELFTH